MVHRPYFVGRSDKSIVKRMAAGKTVAQPRVGPFLLLGKDLAMNIALARHGTKLNGLKPSTIIAAARADLALRQKQVGLFFSDLPAQIRAYSFHRNHVRQAEDVADLLRRALADRYTGYWSSKRETVALYADEEALRAALATTEADLLFSAPSEISD